MESLRFWVEFLRPSRPALAALLVLALGACAGGAQQRAAPVEVAFDRPGAAERLAEAIRIKTVSLGPGLPTADAAFTELHRFLEASYPGSHAALEREVVNEHSRLYTWRGSDRDLAPILLAAHLDVVPIEDGTRELWDQDPFAGTIDESGMIWGRGALDDKLAVLGLLEAVEHLLDEGFAPRRTVYVAFGHDEEIDGELGAQEIAARLEARGQTLAYVLDEGSVIGDGLVPGVEKPVAMIGVAEKGYLTLKLTAQVDAGGHSSTPPEVTAIGRLARAIERVQGAPLPAKLGPPVSDMLAAVAPEMSTFERVAMSNQWLFGGLVTSILEGDPTSNAMVRTTTAPTIVKGGVKDNVLPQSAAAWVNFRILPGDSIESVTAHVERAIGDPMVKVERLRASESEPVPPSDTSSEHYRVIERTVQEIFPEAVVAPALVIAATDSRHYRRVTDNIYRFLPVILTNERLKGIHGNNERLETEAYRRLIAFYIQLLRNSAG